MIINEMPFEEYLDLNRLNCSGVKQLEKSGAHYLAYKLNPVKQTAAIFMGSTVHCAVLEPDCFSARYAVMPEGIDKRTKAGKETYQELLDSGKEIIGEIDNKLCWKIADSVKQHPSASFLLKKGNAEVTVLSVIDGVETKVRIDWLRPEGILVDLKTCEDASPSAFSKQIANYGYDVQTAFYLDSCRNADVKAHTFIFIAVEKSPPYAVAIYELDNQSIDIGRAKYQRALALYQECIENNTWPAYDQNIQTISLPSWAIYQELQQ